MSKKSKSQRKVLTTKNSARSNSKRHREYFDKHDVYEKDAHHVSDNRIRLGLSSSSVSPMTVEETFTQAAKHGYDGVEIMVTHNTETRDVDLINGLARDTGLDVISLHAPTLLFLPGSAQGPLGEAADHREPRQRGGADTVVLHPPFRWQGEYALGFVDGVRQVAQETGVRLAVENMYPWRAGLREIQVYYPDWNPWTRTTTTSPSTSPRLHRRHERLGDGGRDLRQTPPRPPHRRSRFTQGRTPGSRRGTMPVAETLQYLAKYNWQGDVVVEVNTRFVRKQSSREKMLADSIAFAREHLGLDEDVPRRYSHSHTRTSEHKPARSEKTDDES